MADDADLAQVVYDFAIGLPKTIKSEILTFVIAYGPGYGLDSGFDEKLKTLLIAPPLGLQKFGATLCIIGALDYVLHTRLEISRHAKAKLQFLKEKLPESSAAEIALARLPVSQRHLEKAVASWRTLREGVLAVHNLQDYEDRCLNPLSTGKEPI